MYYRPMQLGWRGKTANMAVESAVTVLSLIQALPQTSPPICTPLHSAQESSAHAIVDNCLQRQADANKGQQTSEILEAVWHACEQRTRGQYAATFPTFLQKLTSLRTSARATSCGVVTISAPSTPHPFSSCRARPRQSATQQPEWKALLLC